MFLVKAECKFECNTDRLKGCGITEQHCKSLAGYLRSPNSHLTDLDLSHNALGGSALKQLSTALCDPNCQIQILNLSHNHLQSQDMELIRDVLSGENMNLRVLDLSDNPLGDSGVKILSAGLQSTNCHLEVLKLSGCQIKEGVYQLLSSLKANPSCLRELDLRYNDLGNIGQEILDEYLCSLRIPTGGVCGPQPGLYKSCYFPEVDYVLYPHAYADENSLRTIDANLISLFLDAVTLTFDPQTANEYLYLNGNNTVVTRQKEKQQLPDNDERFDMCNQVLCRPPLSERCFFEVDVIGRDINVGVACEGMERKGASDRVRLGRNEMSWSLCCSDNVCVAQHNQKTVSIPTESIRKLGVFLDREARSLCFYSLSPQIKLLYMFDADFPEDQDLLVVFRIQEPGCSVNLRPESL
ncbi:Ribonuclease inhibitor [Anabarilius grahami]|uniref:Ribonuclease inhibitor n=1 Tax=Anabarilius grahami TaxID=495550 RepID=A0A3N0YBU0_ANAGA|nr:Ribonuclease inhibitor [Anabarilius grahami]